MLKLILYRNRRWADSNFPIITIFSIVAIPLAQYTGFESTGMRCLSVIGAGAGPERSSAHKTSSAVIRKQGQAKAKGAAACPRAGKWAAQSKQPSKAC
jgi:hypothetical protein